MIQSWKILTISFFIFTAISCSSKDNEIFYDRPIVENWQFRKAGDKEWLPAHVPGDIISDLFKNKKIPDPFYQMNEKQVQWVENEDWEYQTTFDVGSGILDQDAIELCFDGLDTYADVFLNDSLIVKSDNVFRSYKVNCGPKIKEKNNLLRVCLHSPVKKGLEKLKKPWYLVPDSNEQALIGYHTNVFTPKAPIQFGWNWRSRLVTRGIWRQIHLQAWSSAKIMSLFYRPKQILDKYAEYSIDCKIESKSNQKVNYDLIINNKPTKVSGELTLKKGINLQNISFSIDHPKLWWSNGLGVPYLYHITFRLKQRNLVIHENQTRLGIRKLEFVHKSDSNGNSFYFKLNNVAVFMKGANYIPSCIPTTQNSNETNKRVIEDAKNANMNMIRVWGGAIYENDEFYDLCDENGILVWQDFRFTYSKQPDDSAYIENIRMEATENIQRLRNHACLALWYGNNDNFISWNNRDWKNNLIKDISKKLWDDCENLFYHILPEAVQKNDPQTDYWTSSPSSENNKLPIRKSGEVHDWRIWFGNAPFEDYRNNPGRFVSEYGVQSFPGMRTINSFSQKSDQFLHSELMDFKQQSLMSCINPQINGNDMILEYIKKYYHEPRTFESLVYLSQVMQAEALKIAIESHRKAMPKCMGSLYWQLNDCSPTMSWSTVDYFGRWKLAHYSVRDAFSPILVVPARENNNIHIQVISDLYKDLDAILLVKLIDFSGKDLFVKQIPVKIKANTSSMILSFSELLVLAKTDKKKCCLIVQLNQPNKLLSQNILYFTEPKNLVLPKAKIDIIVNEAVKGYNLVLKSNVLAKNLYLETNARESLFADNNFDLLPGKRTKINVRYSGTKEELIHDLKITSLFDVQ